MATATFVALVQNLYMRTSFNLLKRSSNNYKFARRHNVSSEFHPPPTFLEINFTNEESWFKTRIRRVGTRRFAKGKNPQFPRKYNFRELHPPPYSKNITIKKSGENSPLLNNFYTKFISILIWVYICPHRFIFCKKHLCSQMFQFNIYQH